MHQKLLAALVVMTGSTAVYAEEVEQGSLFGQSDWTGPYVGLELGGGTATSRSDFGLSSGGVHAGYLMDLGRLVLGAEVGSSRISTGVLPMEMSYVSVHGIVGYDAGRVLPYVVAGTGDLTARTSLGVAEDTIPFVGLGAAFQVNDHLRVSLEHRQGESTLTGSDFSYDLTAFRLSYAF